MRNTKNENVLEHSAQVAMIAHALAIIENTLLGGNVDADRVGMLALYHESAEVITGDLPTPVKYYNREINAAYKDVERAAEEKLLGSLPGELREAYCGLVAPQKDAREYALVKYADKLAAYIKCVEELRMSNAEFKSAHDAIERELKAAADPAVAYFMDNFIGAYALTLDELQL